MPIIYKKLNYPPEIESGGLRTDYICKVVTDDSDNVISDSWIPTDTSIIYIFNVWFITKPMCIFC